MICIKTCKIIKRDTVAKDGLDDIPNKRSAMVRLAVGAVFPKRNSIELGKNAIIEYATILTTSRSRNECKNLLSGDFDGV